jgi:hypothetical protein
LERLKTPKQIDYPIVYPHTFVGTYFSFYVAYQPKNFDHLRYDNSNNKKDKKKHL